MVWYTNSILDLNLSSEPEFYGDLVHWWMEIVDSNNSLMQFVKMISHYKICYKMNALRPSASLVANPITVSNFAFLFNLTLAGWPKILWWFWFKVSKGAKIRNQYNQIPHLTQDANGKVTNSQLDTTNESQEVSPFPAGDQNTYKQTHTKT